MYGPEKQHQCHIDAFFTSIMLIKINIIFYTYTINRQMHIILEKRWCVQNLKTLKVKWHNYTRFQTQLWGRQWKRLYWQKSTFFQLRLEVWMNQLGEKSGHWNKVARSSGWEKKNWKYKTKTYPIPVIKNGNDLLCNRNGCD